MRTIFNVVTLLVIGIVPLSAQVPQGESDLVPNGSFELLALPDQQPDQRWPSRYVYNCLFWRQFHRYFPLNNPDDPRRVPPYEDRIYIDTWPDYYDPVSCSSSDLYCLDQLDCDPITRDGSIYDIPENWFGYQALPAPATEYNRKYAGIYYRLNGIVMGAGGLANEVATSNPATDYWREYLEVELTRPLESGKTYTVQYSLSLGEVSNIGIHMESRLSMLPYWTNVNTPCGAINDEEGLKSKVAIPTTNGPTGHVHITPNPIEQVGGWQTITYNVTAAGGERYLTIGNFEPRPRMSERITRQAPQCLANYYPQATSGAPLANRVAYYYVDDVRVIESGVTCECGANVCFLFTKVDHADPTKCCYKVQVVNGHRSSTDEPIPKVCTIYGITIRDPLANVDVFDWVPNAQLGPITGDGLWHEIGVVCVDAFSRTASKELQVSLRNQSGQVMCSQTEIIHGCSSSDPCGCAKFRNTVKVVPHESSTAGCCYKVLIDASKLVGCQIAAVKIYKGNQPHPQAEIMSGRFTANPVVPSDFVGDLYYFCPPEPEASASSQLITVQFLDATGQVICEHSTQMGCECRCGGTGTTTKPDIRISLTQTSGSPGSCCYEIRMRNTGNCRWSIASLTMQINEQGVVFTPTSAWTSSQSGTMWQFAPVGGPAYVYGEQDVVVGTLCIPPCVSFDAKTIRVTASIMVNGQPCAVPVTASSTASCPGTFSCDDLQVSVKRPWSGNIQTEDCCRFIEATLLNCAASTDGIRVEVRNSSNIPVVVTHMGNGVYASATMCRNWAGDAFVVELRDADGNIICSKPVTMPYCYFQEPSQ